MAEAANGVASDCSWVKPLLSLSAPNQRQNPTQFYLFPCIRDAKCGVPQPICVSLESERGRAPDLHPPGIWRKKRRDQKVIDDGSKPWQHRLSQKKEKGSECLARCPWLIPAPGIRQNRPSLLVQRYWFKGLKPRIAPSAAEQTPAGSTRITASSSAQKPRIPVWFTESGIALMV